MVKNNSANNAIINGYAYDYLKARDYIAPDGYYGLLAHIKQFEDFERLMPQRVRSNLESLQHHFLTKVLYNRHWKRQHVYNTNHHTGALWHLEGVLFLTSGAQVPIYTREYTAALLQGIRERNDMKSGNLGNRTDTVDRMLGELWGGKRYAEPKRPAAAVLQLFAS